MRLFDARTTMSGLLLATMTVVASAQNSSGDSALNVHGYVSGSLCKTPDAIVFSCSIEKNHKIVSMCASGPSVPHSFYYAFGKPEKVEMIFPQEENGSGDVFSRSFLIYPGGTGGYAYTFVKNDIKYIVYSISGAGFDLGGVVVQKIGSIRAMSDMKCKGKIVESSDQSIIDETMKWSDDRDIHVHGLPHVD